MKTAEDILNVKGDKIYCVNCNETVRSAIEVIVENKIGAIIVKENEKFVGIWTERDLLRNAIQEGFSIDTTKISEVMTKELKVADYNDSTYKLIDTMLGLRIRHLLIKKGDEYIGILSGRDILHEDLQQKTKELKSISLVYYENWKNWDD